MQLLWQNGKWCKPRDFAISPFDRGLTLGLGLFETILAVDGVAKFTERHLARLEMSAAKLRWKVEMPDLSKILPKLLERNSLTEGRARIRLAVTAGSGSLRNLTQGIDHVMWLMALPAGEVSPKLSACISPWVRNERSPLSGLKCAAYAENLIALDHARALGFEETLFLNTQGKLCEFATANVFITRDGRLYTPRLDSGCLPGIARQVIIELAEAHGIPVAEAQLTAEDLGSADAVILTSAIQGPVQLTRLDERVFGNCQLAANLRRLWEVKLV